MHLSLVIPAYNEAARIGGTLRQVGAYLGEQGYSSEILVVDDGSEDGTAAVAAEAWPEARVISYMRNRGKGYAVRKGMLEARGEYRVFYDADASTPIDELAKLWPRFDRGADIVIGSRSLPESQVEIRQGPLRESMGRLFNRLLRLLGLTHFPDTQCGFKGFTRRACETAFPRQRIHGYGFDAEILYIAEHHGLRVEQIPIRWLNCPHTRVRAVRDSFRMLKETLRIRANALLGRYDAPTSHGTA